MLGLMILVNKQLLEFVKCISILRIVWCMEPVTVIFGDVLWCDITLAWAGQNIAYHKSNIIIISLLTVDAADVVIFSDFLIALGDGNVILHFKVISLFWHYIHHLPISTLLCNIISMSLYFNFFHDNLHCCPCSKLVYNGYNLKYLPFCCCDAMN